MVDGGNASSEPFGICMRLNVDVAVDRVDVNADSKWTRFVSDRACSPYSAGTRHMEKVRHA